MRFFRPQSFITLLLTGFIFVLLPLLTALFTSVQLLDGLVRQGADAVYHSVDLVHSGRRLSTLLSDEERKVMIYNVLGDLESLDNLNKVHDEIQELLDRLAGMRENEQHVLQIKEFSNLEQHLVTVLNHSTDGPEQRLLQKQEQEKLLDSYKRLNTLAKSIERAGNEVMLAKVDGLKQSVSRGKETLIFQTSGLIIFAVLLIILFVVLLSKPVRQIDRAIDRLGEGDFDTPIDVVGPKDLELLGRRLNWLRRRLADLDREKVRLIAHISHELKTPLASIIEGASLLHDELVGPMNVKQKNVVDILNKNSSRLQELIQNILDFNMAQARQKPEAMQTLSLHTLMEKVLSDQQNSILARKIDLRVTLDPVRVSGNRQQIITIFDNLLSNAVKFTPDQGWIMVKVKKKNGMARCLVADSGPGVAEAERSLIFPPFSQGNQPINESVKSSGLGLAISNEYAENHGGSLRLLTSTKGACFELILPMMEEDHV